MTPCLNRCAHRMEPRLGRLAAKALGGDDVAPVDPAEPSEARVDRNGLQVTRRPSLDQRDGTDAATTLAASDVDPGDPLEGQKENKLGGILSDFGRTGRSTAGGSGEQPLTL